LTENKIPNRTFSSYIPGYNVSPFFWICLEKTKIKYPGQRLLGRYFIISLFVLWFRNLERAGSFNIFQKNKLLTCLCKFLLK
jgi:hypothetical protein